MTEVPIPDTATSTDPAVQAQLDRLFAHGPGTDTLGLDRITRLLARLGDPHRALPPVFHVAGTNGKGSTCAYLRAALEAAGHRVHVYTSPHLVRFNERVRLAGTLIEDAALAPLLAEVLDACEEGAEGLNASFFEVTTAAAILAFARTPADACVIEVGLGGRLDATNVVTPLVTGIAALGIDHQAFLGDTLAQIAREKAGIAKPGVPLVTMRYPSPIATEIAEVARIAGAPMVEEGAAWRWSIDGNRLRYADAEELSLPLPAMPGDHQAANYALAVAMLRHQQRLVVPLTALTMAAQARWPGRLHRLRPGPLTALLPAGAELWVDGAHNPAAAGPIAQALATIAADRPITTVLGMLANKDADGVIGKLPRGRLIAVPTPGHAHHPASDLADRARDYGYHATTAADLPAAITMADTPVVLIAGSLYLAGEALRLNDERPD